MCNPVGTICAELPRRWILLRKLCFSGTFFVVKDLENCICGKLFFVLLIQVMLRQFIHKGKDQYTSCSVLHREPLVPLFKI